MSRIAVLGSGAWGTAIALSLHRRGGHQITLWSHSRDEVSQIVAAGENTLFLPGFPLSADLHVTADDALVANAEFVVSVIPSGFLRPTIARLRPHLHPGQIVVSATKGVEDRTYLRMTHVIAECLGETEAQSMVSDGDDNTLLSSNPDTNLEVFVEGGAPEVSSSGISPAPLVFDNSPVPVGAFSGPSFALEVAQAQPTAITVAFLDPAIAARVQQEFSSESLRLYTTTDVIGVELGGALKNVIAIAAGVAAGAGLGYNSAAALMTRGIAEITRLAVACGGRRETLAGLSGVGDLVLTCTGSLSRNRTVGEALGQGRKLQEILTSLGGKVAEGVLTTHAALGLARQHGVEMPITEQMQLILNEGKDPREAIKDLMLRPGKDEY
ncbi:MAG TPA: NAD(P)H-dependent glycerol-3-phosphate dehydrogenase [Terracidiphilus sp.]|nr:NAD(P)H-dependent glycerol-3-phosphate dehydrogenase [Terracidiphilus sp.]